MSYRTRRPVYPKRKNHRPKALMALVGVVAAVCFWGMVKPSSPPLPLNGDVTRLYPMFSVENPAVDPDVYRLQPLPEQHEDAALRESVNQLLAQAPVQLKPHVYYLNLKTGAYLNIDANAPVPAASVIKLPILLDYFRAVGEGKLSPSDPVLYDVIHQTGGSGELQYKVPGFTLPSLEVARTMIQISDNSSTNIFIDNLGGMNEINQTFKRMGLENTYLQNWLPDLTGTNKISPKDMATVLYNIAYTPYLSSQNRELAMEILKGTHNNRLIPAGLPPKTQVAHKTGDIGESLGDSALVMLPDGNAYLLSIQVERPYNDGNAKPLIIALSRQIYEHQQASSSLAHAEPGTSDEARF